MKRKINYEISLMGFIVGLLLCGLFVVVIGQQMATFTNNYDVGGEGSVDIEEKYSAFAKVPAYVEPIRNATQIAPQPSSTFDIVGGIFTAGWKSLTVAWNSISFYNEFVGESREELTRVSSVDFTSFFILVFMIMLVVGVGIAALLKWRL